MNDPQRDRQAIGDVPKPLGLDSFHAFASQTRLDELDLLDPRKTSRVQRPNRMRLKASAP